MKSMLEPQIFPFDRNKLSISWLDTEKTDVITYSYDYHQDLDFCHYNQNVFFTDNKFKKNNISFLSQYLKSDSYTTSVDSQALPEFDNDYKEKEKISQSFEKQILEIISSEDYEEGKKSLIEEYMEKPFSKNELALIKNIIQRIALANLNNRKIINGILRILNSRSYDEMCPEGQFIALSLLQNNDITLREKGIQVFEYWRSKRGIDVLKSLKCDRRWLQNYVNDVIANLEKYGSL